MPFQITGLTPLLEIFDMPTSLAFYRDILGFEVLHSTPGWCMLKHGDVTLMLNTAYDEDERPPQPDPGRVRGHGDTSLYFDVPNPDEVYAHLRSKGWPCTEPVITTYRFRQVSSKDPDGFQLFFLCPADPE